nr:hypothetical protein [Kibdelosporangium sp. MJ126-NF4]
MTKIIAVAVFVAATLIPPATAAPAAPCWTSFDPGNPQGGAMRHYYRNCADRGSFTSAFQDGGGNQRVYANRCAEVDHDRTVVWYYPETQPPGTASYTTVFCEGNRPPLSWRTGQRQDTDPCWTTFDPINPQGGTMQHYYYNCADRISVAPAFRDNSGGLHVYASYCVDVPRGEWVAWHYPETQPAGTASYTTVLCEENRPPDAGVIE